MTAPREEPIACSLTPAQLAAVREGLLPGLVKSAAARERVPNGLRWRFEHREGLERSIAAVLEAERRCCRFLRFVVTLEPAGGSVWLEVTGPEGTEKFLLSLVE